MNLLKDEIVLEDNYEISEGDHIIREIKDTKEIEVVEESTVLEEQIENITKDNNDESIEIDSINNLEKIK